MFVDSKMSLIDCNLYGGGLTEFSWLADLKQDGWMDGGGAFSSYLTYVGLSSFGEPLHMDE